MKVGAGLSESEDPRDAAREATGAALASLDDRRVDLAMVFASPHHGARAEEVLAAVHEEASPGGLIGCVAEAVLGGPREVEEGPAVSVWVGTLPVAVETFHMDFVRTESGGAFGGWRFQPADGAGRPVHLLICDPFTFPADLLLQHLNETVPGSLAVGGMASGGHQAGSTVLFQDHAVHHDGAVGARLPGAVAVRTLVSQGCRPVGEPFVVTRADGNFLYELGGKPPLERLRDLVSSLPQADRELVAVGLHLGRVIDEYKTEHEIGDFLVRGVMGADPESGALAVGDVLEVGQTVRFHVRDAATADEELRSMLQDAAGSLPGHPAGALLFTCNGRGRRLFHGPDHDAGLVSAYLGGAPLAGFFCAGELGPVGGRNFLHGYTASLAVFLDDGRSPG